jgi:hypothetical protein
VGVDGLGWVIKGYRRIARSGVLGIFLCSDKRLRPFVTKGLKHPVTFAEAVWQSRNNAKLTLREAQARPGARVIPDGL